MECVLSCTSGGNEVSIRLLIREQAVELIAQVKEFLPPWVRIMRVHREFPVHLIQAGVKSGNLRNWPLCVFGREARDAGVCAAERSATER